MYLDFDVRHAPLRNGPQVPILQAAHGHVSYEDLTGVAGLPNIQAAHYYRILQRVSTK
jgi:hypothetical protein